MEKNRLILCLAWLAVLFLDATVLQAQSLKKRPNIIFILADDLGYGNVRCYNARSPIPTPNIDQLATEGTRFTNFYSGSTVCAPSRGSLMTGLHTGHAYVRGNAQTPLRSQDTTLAQRLQMQGYRTGMFGKWGLGEEQESGAPHLKGFDEFLGYLNQKHAHSYYTTHLFEVKAGNMRKLDIDTAVYTPDLIMESALSFIKANKEKPFFLYLPVTLPHAKLQVPNHLLAPFRKANGESMFSPEKPVQGQNQPHAAFAAMVTRLDNDVARVLKLVQDLGLDENTYIFFTSDNGPHRENGGDPVYFNSSGELRGIKRDLYEGGIRVPLIVRAPGIVPAGKVRAEQWAFWDIQPTIQELIGAPSNTPVDGLSFKPVLIGKKQKAKHEYLYWQFCEGQLREAVLTGRWKLIRLKDIGKPEVLELYDLKNDIAETKNLVSIHSKKVKSLRLLMDKASVPADNSNYDWSAYEK
jgi:arylsulfatase A-like enzyme